MKKLFPVLVSAGLLSACIGGGQPAIKDVFYQLPAPQLSQQPGSPLIDCLVVRPLRSDGLRRERAMLFSEEAGDIAIQRFSYRFWSDNPTALIERYMVAYLQRSGLARRVLHEEAGLRGDYLLTGRLLNFEQIRIKGETTQVQVSLQLQLTADVPSEKSLIKTYPVRIMTEQESMLGITHTFATALDQVLDSFIRDASGLLGKHKTPDQ